MKTNHLFNNTIIILAIVGLVGFTANNSFSQQVKKKIVRVIENDGKGEKVIKEYDITNNKQRFDSITRDVHKKMKIEQKKIDSLEHVLMISLPNHLEIPPIPEMPDIPGMYIDAPDAPFFELENDSDFDFFAPCSEDNSTKVYYSEKNLDKSGNLDKILEDLENGTFDPQKWNMKELEKDKIKDFKTNGKGEVIVFNNQLNSPHAIQWYNPNPHKNAPRNHVEARMRRNGHRMVYIDADSLNKNFETYTISSSGDSGEEGWHMIDMKRNGEGKHRGNGHHIEFYNFDSDNDSTEDVFSKSFTIESLNNFDEPNSERHIIVGSDGSKSKNKTWTSYEGTEGRTIIIANNNNITKFDYLKPSVEELSMMEKSGFLKTDKSKLLDSESVILIPRKEQGKYTLKFKEEESGKVKVVIANDKGNVIKTEEFEHSKGKTEKEVEIKDLKSGVYFIQAQMNGKTTTSKLKIDEK